MKCGCRRTCLPSLLREGMDGNIGRIGPMRLRVRCLPITHNRHLDQNARYLLLTPRTCDSLRSGPRLGWSHLDVRSARNTS